MQGVATRILKALQAKGELSLYSALRLARSRHGNHIDQYPLALLIEEGYVGITINHTPPEGAETMREFSLATTLHMFGLPKDERGQRHYLRTTSSGSIDPQNERVFLKAKGALYLDERRQKFRDRIYSFLIGFLGGVLAAVLSAWLRGHFRLP
jgi:hypothetical protein